MNDNEQNQGSHEWPHQWPLRVYYEDTDAGGVVFYARYLHFTERARTEWLRNLGFAHGDILAKFGLNIVVRELAVVYYTPAKLDDALMVATTPIERVGGQLTLGQNIFKIGQKSDKPLLASRVILVCINRMGKPVRWPAALTKALGL
jgi:acyl-CoA thioester hydrolase